MAHKAYMSGEGGGLLAGISIAALLVFGHSEGKLP